MSDESNDTSGHYTYGRGYTPLALDFQFIEYTLSQHYS